MDKLTHNPQFDGESGMALLMVLAVLAATTILAAHMMLVAETVSKDAKVAATTSSLRYQAESAADMAFWMHLTDRRLFSDRSLGNDLEDREATSDFEPWMLDRRGHYLFDDTCQVYLGDAIKSISISNLASNLKSGVDVDDTDTLDIINSFVDVYNDYTDNDDLLNLYGMEKDDYASQGYYTLPRNNTMQFREEIYWLDNWQNVVTGEITIIPPKGVTISQNNNSKPSFFTATETDFINNIEDLGDTELQAILDARDEWINNATPLEETLDADLLLTIKGKFSFTESGYAEITAVATDQSGEIRVVKTITREVNMRSKSIYADRSSQTFAIWEIRTQ